MLHAGDKLHLLRAIREAGLLRRRTATADVRMHVVAATSPPDEIWSELHARLRGFVGRRIADPHAADDIAQEVLLRLHRSLGDLRTEDRLDAFAYRIARNAIIDHYRATGAAKETPAASDEFSARLESIVADEPAQREGREQLARCLEPLVEQLSPRYRDALRLTDLGDHSQVEAARLVGLSVPGMKARVQRARAQVRDLLTDCCRVTLDRSRHIAEVERTGPCACTRD